MKKPVLILIALANSLLVGFIGLTVWRLKQKEKIFKPSPMALEICSRPCDMHTPNTCPTDFACVYNNSCDQTQFGGHCCRHPLCQSKKDCVCDWMLMPTPSSSPTPAPLSSHSLWSLPTMTTTSIPTNIPTPTTISLPTNPPIPTIARPPDIPGFVPDGRMNQTLLSVPDQGMGLCWWVSPALSTSNFVNWAYDVNYTWALIEPREGEYKFNYYDESLSRLRGKNKGYLLYFLTAGVDRGNEYYPTWLITKVQQNHPRHWIAYDIGGGPAGHFIAPWDPDWQAALDRLAFNLAFKYDNDPNIIGVVIPSGCRYGEMSCYTNSDTEKNLWIQAGYTDEKFTEAVEQVVTIFLRYFQKKPVYVQLGSGLYGQGTSTCWKLMSDMYATYGLRVRYKKNSWGSTGTDNEITDQYYRRYGPYTNVGWEVGYQFNFSSRDVSQQLIERAITYEASYACLGIDLLGKWQELWYYFSRYAGTHIIMTSSSYSPGQVSTNQDVLINTSFLNRGNKPLVAPKRVGIKDEPASYSLAVYFINKTTGNEIKRIINPSVPTNEWYGGYSSAPVKTINGNVQAPTTPGSYDVKIALENPHPGPHLGETWPTITDKQRDSKNRYLLGELQVN